MAKYELKYPLEVDGKTISSVTLRRPKGRDMTIIGDHVATLGRFYASNAAALGGILKQAAGAGAAAAAEGATEPPAADDTAAALTPPDAAVYRAMVAVAGQLADLGEDVAGDLDMVDLQQIVAQALNPGEA